MKFTGSALMAVYSYQTQAVRELAWACFSPPLLDCSLLGSPRGGVGDCELSITPQRRQWLSQLDRDPTALLDHLAKNPSPRLGIYFEQLWHFFLQQDAATELVAHNLAVREGGRTLGEFDCLYWCRERQRHIHLELAVKFFLGHSCETSNETQSQWKQWLGPNSKDRLDLKIAQLMQRQITLGEQPRAKEQLAELGIHSLQREVVIKGYLFQPLQHALPPPPGLNLQQALSQWLEITELAAYLQELAATAFLILDKPRWLAPARTDGQEPVLSRSRLQKALHSHFAQNTRALLVSGLSPQGEELCRFFVVQQGWPLVATRYNPVNPSTPISREQQ